MPPLSFTRRAALTGLLSGASATLIGSSAAPTGAAAMKRSWLSGAGDPQPSHVSGGGFGTWRGEASTYARIWADATLPDMTNVWMMDSYKASGWNGTLDIACGGPRDGHTWQSAAAGGMDTTWRTACRSIRAKWGKLAQVHLSMAHEMNGDWYPWSVHSGNVTDFKKAWQRWYAIVQSELVAKGKDALVCLNMNADTATDVSVVDMVPDARSVDILGVDFYSMWPDIDDEDEWAIQATVRSLDGSPRGVQAWFDYAKSLAKPISVPEWGVNPSSRSDNPFFIKKMNSVFSAHSGLLPKCPGAGQLAGEAYFNDLDNCRLWPSTNVPRAAAAYRALSWGK